MGALTSLPALDVKPAPQGPSPLENYAQATAIEGQRQLQQQRGIEIQQAQQQLRDQQASTKAWLNWDGKSYDDLAKSALKYGASANAAASLQQHGLAVKTAMSQLDEKQLENLKTKHDLALGELSTLDGLDDAHLAPGTLNSVMKLRNQGLLSPDEAQPFMQAAQQMMPSDLRQFLKLHEKQLIGEKQQLAEAQSQAEAQKNVALGQEAQANTSKSQAETEKTQAETQLLKQYGGASEAQQQARYMNIQMKKRQGMPLTPEENAFSGAFEHMKTLVPVANFNLQNAGLAGTQQQPSAIAQAIAKGDMKWQDAVSPRTPASVKEALLKEVKQINPGFNSGDFQIEQDVRKEFTSGDAAKNLTAFNTAIEHANQLQQAADNLDNKDPRILNKIGNAIGYQFGSDRTTNFNVIKNALSGEISKVFKGGQATDAEIREVQEPFSSANSPQQLKGAIQNAIRLMNSKRDALKAQYEAGRTAQPNFGGQSSVIYARDPQGKLHQAPAGTPLPAGWKQESR